MTSADWQALAAGVGLVATDLDGTLLRPDLTVSRFTVEALARARAGGLPVVFVTGRPPRWIPDVVAVTGHSGVGICANGAVVLDLETGSLIETHAIDATTIEDVVAVLRAEVPGIAFALEWVGGQDTQFAYEQAYGPRWPVPDQALVADIGDLVAGREVVKLLGRVIASEHDADGFLDVALTHVAHLVTVTHSNADDVLIEMSALGVTKGTSLASHAIALGYPAAQVAAVGDMPNDVPMIEWAGVGLGVTGAHPRVLAAADAVLPAPEHDGVARFVEAALEAR